MTTVYGVRRTKIVATIGDAAEPIIGELIDAGVNVFRINMSHKTPKDLPKLVAAIRGAATARHAAVAILGDLSGPKMRLGRFPQKYPVAVKSHVALYQDNVAMPVPPVGCDDVKRVTGLDVVASVPLAAAGLVAALKVGNRVYIDDGRVQMRVVTAATETQSFVVCCVVFAGEISSRKGVHTPDATTYIPAVTAYDKTCIPALIEHGVDYIALSYVQRPGDIAALRDECQEAMVKVFGEQNARSVLPPWLIAKIEKPSAVEEIHEIIRLSDGIMVARGDLGVECSLPTVPGLQKAMIAQANQQGKVVITATEMLQSMITSSVPTRAEVSDVANAVWDGTDAVMLSGETAVGHDPVGVVAYMSQICVQAEKDIRHVRNAGHESAQAYHEHNHESEMFSAASAGASKRQRQPKKIFDDHNAMLTRQRAFHHSLARAALHASHSADLIVCFSSGYMARLLSKLRPDLPVVCFTDNFRVKQRLALWWGIFPIYLENLGTQHGSLVNTSVAPISTDAIVGSIVRELQRRRFVPSGMKTLLQNENMDSNTTKKENTIVSRQSVRDQVLILVSGYNARATGISNSVRVVDLSKAMKHNPATPAKLDGVNSKL
eukprot:PhM_4_TR1247/c3_g2_i1/m.28347/K00873/PK, pyk; pyruvate kinase